MGKDRRKAIETIFFGRKSLQYLFAVQYIYEDYKYGVLMMWNTITGSEDVHTNAESATASISISQPQSTYRGRGEIWGVYLPLGYNEMSSIFADQ
jgi:hypothetical protein